MKAREIDWGPPGTSPDTWPWSLTDKGKRHSNHYNIGVALSCDAQLQKLVWYDSFLDRLLTGASREWTDADDIDITSHLQDAYALNTIRPGMVRDSIDAKARAAPRHCVREWLESLTWDQVPRVAEAFEDHWGAESGSDQPQDFLRAASANFFVSLIARVMRPGCKVDTMPVFEGPQGIFKSSALEALGGNWHVVSHESVTSKDFFQVLQGAWIVELSELDTISRAEVTRVKSVISTRVDRYRASYGRSAQDHPRQCVFAGTTNADNWGRDETGLRRFWPIKCGAINLATLRESRDQLFAEACVLFHAKRPWWDMPSTTTDVQSRRQQESAWMDIVAPWLLGKSEVTAAEVLRDGLKIEPARMTRPAEMEVARLLRLLGWTRVQRRVEGTNRRIWIAPSLDTPEQF